MNNILFQLRSVIACSVFLISVAVHFISIEELHSQPKETVLNRGFVTTQKKQRTHDVFRSEQEREERRTDEPHLRLEYERLRTVDPEIGTLPNTIRELELQVAERLSSKNSKNTDLLSPHGKAGLLVSQIGPRNVGGRTRAFAIDRRNPKILLIGAVTGGVWRSIDKGLSWVRTSPANDVHNVSAIIQHPNPDSSDIWYMGTGEVLSTTERRTSTNLRTIGTGRGIYRSSDNGITWSRITPEILSVSNSLTEMLQGVWRLTGRRYNAVDELYSACYGGIMKYSDSKWTLELGDTTRKSFNTDIVASSDGGVLYASLGATIQGETPGQYGIYQKIQNGTWQNITPPGYSTKLRRTVLAVAPSNPYRLYAFCDEPLNWSSAFQVFSARRTLWRYDGNANGTGSWTNVSSWIDRADFTTLAGYTMALTVHPKNPDVVYVGGTDLYRTFTGFKSNDSSDVQHLGGYPYIVQNGYLHPDLHSVVVAPNGGMYVVGDGGVAFLQDEYGIGTPEWFNLNDGYFSTQVYYVAMDKGTRDDNLVVAGFQDNSNFCSTQSSSFENWKHVGGGDGCGNQVMNGGSIVFSSSQRGFIYAWRNNQGFPDYLNFAPPYVITDSNVISQQFCTHFQLSADNSLLALPLDNRLYVYRNPEQADNQSINHQENWQWLDLGTSLRGGIDKISAIRFAENSTTLLMGTTTGLIFRVDNMNQSIPTIRNITPTNFQANSFISSIDIYKGRVVISTSLFNRRSIFSIDSIPTQQVEWNDVSRGLEPEGNTTWGPSVRVVRWFKNPQGELSLLAGTTVGLYSLQIDKSSADWEFEASNSVGVVTVEDIEVRHSDSRVVIGTHANGVFVAEPDLNVSVNDENANHSLGWMLYQNYPNPCVDFTSIQFYCPDNSNTPSKVILYDVLGKPIAVLFDGLAQRGMNTISLPSQILNQLTSGVYYISLHTNQGQSNFTKSIMMNRMK
jgi:hypothetical protein